MTRDEMLAFVDAVLGQVRVPHAVVTLRERRLASVRFGQNRITQNMDTFTRVLDLSLGDGTRKAEYSSHRIDKAAIPEILSTCMGMLETAAPDPEYMPPVESGQVYSVIESWDGDTAAVDPVKRTEAASRAVGAAQAAGAEAAGLAFMESEKTALGTSSGNLCFHQGTEAGLQLTMHANGGSSYRSVIANAWGDLDIDATVDGVVSETLSDREPAEFPGGTMDMVLEPQAVADLMPFIAMSLNARTSDEGVTVFAGRMGEKVTSDRFTLYSELGGPVPGEPFDGDGLASEDRTWIRNGVVEAMHCDRFWAQKTGRPAVSSPGCYYLAGDSGTSAKLAEKAGRCLLVRRLWYIRFVDQKTLELTGMTRDGVFLVEDGVMRPVKDFRWNWKPLDIFSRIDGMGAPERKGMFMVPPVLLRDVKV
jgi:predicted Zn-dependent protease